MSDKIVNLQRNHSVEYYNFRTWCIDNQTYVEGVDQNLTIPHTYCINTNASNIIGEVFWNQ